MSHKDLDKKVHKSTSTYKEENNSGQKKVNIFIRIAIDIAFSASTVSLRQSKNVDICRHQIWLTDIFGLFSCLAQTKI